MQGWVEQVERSAAALPTALEEARQARAMVERLEADWMTIAGADAV
jgi:hypothetical protein